MKTIKYIISFMLLTVLVIAGCEGPVGSKGEQGEQGIPGPVGPAGENGAKIHAGSEKPEDTLGEPGDFYLNLVTGELYGPKEESGWGDSPLHLTGADGQDGKDGENGTDGKDGADGQNGTDGKDGADGQNGADGKDGQDGADGKDGSRIFAGDGAPSAGLGKKGDFYLDTGSYLLYGPKKDGGWGSPINLKGPVGPKGDKGDPGPEGPAGPPGADGNANVIWSEWLNADWNEKDDPKEKVMQIPIEEISHYDLVNNTLVVMYLRQWGSGSNYVMPSSGRWHNVWYSFTFGSNFVPGIRVRLESTDGSDLTEFQYAAERGNRFRYILIPGNMPSKIQDGFFDNYEAVKEYYGIPD